MGLPAGTLGFDSAYITEPLLQHAGDLGFGVLFDPRAPQADDAPSCCCPLRPKSYDFDDLPEVPNAPGRPGANEHVKPGLLCTQKSITVDPKKLVKDWQQYPHRSPKWRAIYKAVRNAIERNHSQSKSGFAEALNVHDRRGLRGKANAGLMAAFLLAAHNIRLIRSWLRNAQRDTEDSDLITGLPVKNQRGDRLPWHSQPAARPGDVEPGPAPPPAGPVAA